MNRNKFNLKDKKTKIIISSTIIIVLLLFIGIGLGLSSMNNTDSKNIATQGQDKTDKNKVDSNKNESKKEDSTKEETNVSSDKKEESTSEGTETSSKEESKSESSDTGSSSSNSEVTNKPSTGSSSSSGSSSSGSTSKPEAHTHSWNPVTTTVHHDEVGHWEDVLIQDAWTEEVPVYEDKEVAICNGCGADITSNIDKHMTDNILAGNMACTGWHTEWKQVQVGTNKVNHGAVYDKKYVVDKAAWDETVTTGYQCSCGATK